MAGLFKKHFKPAPEIRALLNIGCLMDIPTGDYFFGSHGESILNGGLAPLTGIGGRGNTYKSTVGHHMNLTVLDRYFSAEEMLYDTEVSGQPARRVMALSRRMRDIAGIDLVQEGRVFITDASIVKGNSWFDELKKLGEEKVKETQYWGTTPFINKAGEPIKVMMPSLAFIDSFSRMPVDAVDAIYEKNEIGESGANMSAAKDAGAKHQMLIQMPSLTARAGIYMTLAAHVDDELVLDPYAPNQKKLAFLKNKLKFKYVSNQYHFLMNNLWYAFDASPATNQTTKAAEYPRNAADTDKDNKDLMYVTIQNLRGKYGASGSPIVLVVSQTSGVLVGLSEFHHLKTRGRFGLGGSDRNYYLELCPDIPLQRTTVRSKIDEHANLRRGLEIVSEMEQMFSMWFHLPQELVCTPKELYEDLKEQGYDWDILLNHTRGFWTFEEDNHPLKFLSTMDLLRMRAKLYRPWWYDDYVKELKG